MRPKISLHYKWLDYLLEVVSFLVLVSIIGLFFCRYQDLPDEIPLHYDLSGKADRFGSKREVWLLLLVTILIYLSLTFLKKFPHIFNYPIVITSNNASYQYTLAVRMLRILKLIILLIFFHIFYSVLKAKDSLPFFAIVLEISSIFITLIIYLILASKNA
ncbi:MAG: DUF1648 domain-containing protein [Thermaurantimonas sp.]|uniref:DUF1648 domain-containing protein n=1 Tax=Thermaurantimonas aggregans TaxID=2173829 RepID=A0A401XJ25_9FLAO|nr:hypothetical protein JCM31826_05040 [Thermaurantimonas aggregans]